MAQTYLFDKNEVLNTLHSNRANHRKIFEEALEGYKVTAIKRFEENIEKIRRGKLVSYINLTLPVDQTKDYDRVISMLERSIGDTVELTEEQFANYILDDWSWKKGFLASNAFYSATASVLNGADDD